MPRLPAKPVVLPQSIARQIWLRAQGLAEPAPFGSGPEATPQAIAHLGYVQIDTIHVIERCHHHILYSRIPDYRRDHLRQAQSVDKSVFEYWTHALSYVPIADLPCFIGEMKRHRLAPGNGFDSVSKQELSKVLARIRRDGALSIRDIADDELVEKTHAWASKKPSKRALQLAFYNGAVTISARAGMLKTYELIDRHFGWEKAPRAATEKQVLDYLLDRAVRSQGVVSLDSICHLDAKRKPMIRAVIEARVRRGQLVPAVIAGGEQVAHWVRPALVDAALTAAPTRPGVHILSPFDPLIIQRKRLQLFFDYEHRFEAYVPKEKRVYGYFSLPVLVDDEVVAAIDLKTDRAQRKLLVQQWTWVGQGNAARHQARIDEALHRFERFQLDGH
ncbi:winged helix-turn-helix domain-containing protein [Schauerella aestuarii]|uniref:winged helix-turn-helix domain-containing protein n=1 Tax=Schauerella aestuarii TaxID=2511204 RepID=UPI00136B7CC1|nr:crosslink repair DNA glycosylase YcaQ family protein [Achromobacter aestuarii]MYZ45713.1 winged helix-turn-helix domain-containing protein [Achromobacter aestuarii]